MNPVRSGLRPSASISVALVLAGCAAAPTPEFTTAPSATPTWVRRVYAFEVRDSTGTPYVHPLFGGLNLPRPQFVDIDADGDHDLFVQEYSNRIIFFENVGKPAAPRYRWRTDEYAGADVGEWYRFTDMDGDADYDLLSEEPFSYIRYYRNDGDPQRPRFTLATDTLKDAMGAPLFADRQNIPNVADIDCNGRLDLFIGRVTGTVMRYEEAAGTPSRMPRFQLVTERFEEIEIVAQIGSRHGANTMAWEDIDRDGDLDLFWGDFFEPGVLLIENTGSCANPSLRGQPVPFPVANPIKTSGYNAPAFTDIDGDGDVDFFVGVLGGAFNPNLTTVDNFHFLEADGTRFDPQTGQFLTTVDVGSESIPTLVDLDGDADYDLLLANKIDPHDLSTSLVYHFENVGTSRQPAFRLTGTWEPLKGAYHYAPAFGDLDGDGDLDMLVGTWKDELAFYRNDGTAARASFVLVDSVLVELTRGSNATPFLADIDGDRDLDLFVGEGSGTVNFYRNDGGLSSPRFTLVSDRFNEIDIGRRSAPYLADLDEDGDLDLFLGTESKDIAYFRNDGTPMEALFVADSSFFLPVQPFATPAFADLDGDGDLDVLAGGIGGGVIFFENQRSGG